MTVIQVGFFLLIPMFIKKYEGSRVLSILSPVPACYLVGIIISQFSIFELNAAITRDLLNVSISLAMPMLLFSTNFLQWVKLSKRSLLAFGFLILSVLISAFFVTLLTSSAFENYWNPIGMLTALFIGGTPNMAALTAAVNIPNEEFIILNSVDVLLGGVYLLFFLVLGIRWLGKLLPQYRFHSTAQRNKIDEFKDSSIKSKFKDYILATLLACLSLGISIGLSFLLFDEVSTLTIIISVSTLGILFSLSRKVRNIKGSFDAGIYFILIFSLAAGSLTDFKEIMNVQNLSYFVLYLLMITMTTVFHISLCWFYKIDRDTCIITSFSGIYGPPFVGVLAASMNNREIVVAGISCGLVGYALGNYLGILVIYALQL